ncbi:probable ubiquitin-conjugating enzyme E2 26 [Chenopodium quinoa]|uniref:probable ubiquitin-conjugating enzyme E2 26 n=1 Tax=Chenopodium quinoa TaxID=63459 RepID=UPI000B794EF7|nr:probable ubiquitin-conjugating enzyme E2 26 [Chenopodium quinoa]
MEDPTIPIQPPRKSKKRMFAGSSSSSSLSFKDPDVIEIPRPSTWKSKPRKQNLIVGHEIIVVDDEDPADAVIIGEKAASNGKGKKPMLTGHEVITLEDEFDGFDFGDVSYDDQYAMLQSHVDSVDIPSRTEAFAHLKPASAAIEKHAKPASNSSLYGSHPYSKFKYSGSKVDHFSSTSSNKYHQINDYLSVYPRHKSKHSFSTLPTSQKHAQTSGNVLPVPPYLLPVNSATLNFPHMPYSYGSAYAQPSQHSIHGIQDPILTSSSFTSAFTNNNSGLEGICADISPPSSDGQGNSSENSILKKLEQFKKFDTLEDHVGHFYENKNVSLKPSKSWVNKIADEWRMLEKDLPDTIFVRVYEARMDLLRAVIVGADGTPYHDGLFFFDVNFSATYPNKPPHVNYHAHGLRMNPNLYNCGKVCLSLLGTWSGSRDENWRPNKSNMLQVLVSIQGLILNEEPYYNEPGYAHSKSTSYGIKSSKNYSENVFLLSLKTMLYTLRNPPKYFEDLVYGHFYQRAHDILAACRAYLDGVEVGSFVKGKTQTTQGKKKTCSQSIKMSLPGYIKSLVEAFTKIGVKGCEKYLVPMDKCTKR